MWQNIKDLRVRVHSRAINHQGVRDDNRDEKKWGIREIFRRSLTVSEMNWIRRAGETEVRKMTSSVLYPLVISSLRWETLGKE